MRQARVIRYLVVAALLLLLAACGSFPGMRTSMPPPPAETPPGEAAAPAPAPAPAPDLAQQVQNLEARVQQLESRLAATGRPPGGPGACQGAPRAAPLHPQLPQAGGLQRRRQRNIIPRACASTTPRNTARPGTSSTST